jgi:hypothetical protein
MSGIQWVITGLAIFGFLPMSIVLYKMRLVKKILNTGLPATATVYKVITPTGKQSADTVYYSFFDREGAQYTGVLSIKPGTYRERDTLEIWYLPANPRRNTVKGAWASPIILIFVILIALFVLFAAYKINEMVQTGAM